MLHCNLKLKLFTQNGRHLTPCGPGVSLGLRAVVRLSLAFARTCEAHWISSQIASVFLAASPCLHGLGRIVHRHIVPGQSGRQHLTPLLDRIRDQLTRQRMPGAVIALNGLGDGLLRIGWGGQCHKPHD